MIIQQHVIESLRPDSIPVAVLSYCHHSCILSWGAFKAYHLCPIRYRCYDPNLLKAVGSPFQSAFTTTSQSRQSLFSTTKLEQCTVQAQPLGMRYFAPPVSYRSPHLITLPYLTPRVNLNLVESTGLFPLSTLLLQVLLTTPHHSHHTYAYFSRLNSMKPPCTSLRIRLKPINNCYHRRISTSYLHLCLPSWDDISSLVWFIVLWLKLVGVQFRTFENCTLGKRMQIARFLNYPSHVCNGHQSQLC